VAYDGTDYCGWQLQPKDRTVQGDLEAALEKMHKRRIITTASGRTDSGVHARGQVVHFDTDIASLPVDKIPKALNSMLPWDVRVTAAREVDPEFHARFQAKVRVYHYYLRSSAAPDPMGTRYAWTMEHQPNLKQLNALAAEVVGTHDFTTFTAAGDPSPTRVRRLLSSVFFVDGPHLVYRVAGTAFLWHMVRSLVGTMVSLEKEGHGASEMARILKSRDRSQAGTTAPSRGLFLEKVYYDENHPY